MNIAILISTLNYGGAEKQAVIDANLLAADNNVWLITFKSGPQNELLDKKVIYLKFHKKSYISTAFKLARFSKEKKIDIIHASLFAAMVISALSSFISKVKIIWHFHSHEYDLNLFSRLTFIICSRFKGVMKIFFVSRELKENLAARFFLPASKLGILYNTTSLKYKDYADVENNDGITVIGYIGRIIGLKRIKYLIELAEYLKLQNLTNFEIWLIGDGDKRKELEELTKKKELSEVVRFLGFQKDTQKYYSQFDLFILPSGEECLSIALIDAGIMGVPAIAFDIGGNNEIIENDKNGFIVNTKEELFEKTRQLICDNDLRQKFSKNSILICSEKFSRNTRKSSLISISENVIKK